MFSFQTVTMGFIESELEIILTDKVDDGHIVAIIHTVVTILAMLPNIFLIIVLAKYQVLKTTRNILIMNWAILDLLTQLSNMDKVDLLYSSITGHQTPPLIMLGTLSFYLMCHFHELVLLFVMFTDFCYKKLTVPKLQRAIPFFWIIFCCICLPIVAFGIVYRNINGCVWQYVIMLLILVGAFLTKTFTYLFRRATRKPWNQNIRYILTTGYIATLIMYITSYIHGDLTRFIPFLHIFLMLGFLFYPFVIVFVLYQLDNDFKQCAKKLFRKNNFSDSVTYQVENAKLSQVV